MLSLSGPNVLLFLQLLIALIIRSAVNVCAISIVFLLVSLATNRVLLDEVCLASFEVLNCWLNLSANCLDDESEISLKVIASFSTLRLCTQMPFWMSLFSLCSSGKVGSLLRRLSRLVITESVASSRVQCCFE